MFNLLKRNPSPLGLLSSGLYNESTFYRSFIRDVKNSKREVIIESPFLTIKRANELAPLFRKVTRRGVKVRINTRIPRHQTRDLRIQSQQAIEMLKSVGVRVFICSDHRHHKVAVIDNTILWEGSLNILSQSNSREVMRRTESAQLAKQMVRFLRLKGFH